MKRMICCLFLSLLLFLTVVSCFARADDVNVCIDGKIKCPTRPFIKGTTENFYVTLNNTGQDDIQATIKFRAWDYSGRGEWDFFDQTICIVPSESMNETDPGEVSLTWPGCWDPQPWGDHWPGRIHFPRIRAELYIDDVLLDTQENMFVLGLFII
jgi:hypothetical protein